MKKLLLFTALFISFCAIAQDFPKDKPELLVDKLVKIKPLNDAEISYYRGGYPGFYTDEKLTKIYKENSKMRTPADAFGDRTFKVFGAYPYSAFGKMKYSIKLVDTATQEIIYSDYNPEDRTKYFFTVIGGLTLPADFYCTLVTEKTNDKGQQELSAFAAHSYYLTRTKKAGKFIYELIFETQLDKLETGKGITVLLMNGEKIERPNTVVHSEVSKNGVTSNFYALIELTPAELQLLSKHEVKNFTLYKYQGFFPRSFAEDLRGAVNCMMSKK